MGEQMEVHEALSLLRPVAIPVPLTRLGGDSDGAYLVPRDLDGVVACFSPGVDTIKTFEDELLERFDIDSHLCDFTSGPDRLTTPLVPGRQTFEPLWLDVDGGPDSVNLTEWVQRWRPDPADDLILQIDIEGAEYRNLLATPPETLARFRVIVMELHRVEQVLDPELYERELGPLLRHLSAQFVCAHVHPNNVGGWVTVPGTDIRIPRLLEVTFLRRDRYEAMSPTAVTADPASVPVSLPHPLDIAWNRPDVPPMHLGAGWCDKRSPESEAKVVADGEAYAAWVKRRMAAEDAFGEQWVRDAMSRSVDTLHSSDPSDAGDPVENEHVSDVALGRPFTLTSAYSDWSLTGVVEPKAPFFFHTGEGAGQSITIELAEPTVITEVVLANRTDICQERARRLLLILEDDAGGRVVHPIPPDAAFLAPGGAECVVHVPRLIARRVIIESALVHALHLSDLRVLGFPVPSFG